MRIEIIMSKLFGFSSQTYFNWKKNKEERKIINLLEKYLTKEDLIEFLETEKINKFDNLNKTLEQNIREKKSNYTLAERVAMSLILLTGLDDYDTKNISEEIESEDEFKKDYKRKEKIMEDFNSEERQNFIKKIVEDRKSKK